MPDTLKEQRQKGQKNEKKSIHNHALLICNYFTLP